jgi:glycerate kinase
MAHRILIAPDKFKGSLTSFEVCDAIAEGIRQVSKTAEILSFPMADGGDGFAEVMKYYLQTDTIYCTTADPLGRSIPGSYQWNPKAKTAIIEMAVASGLVLLKQEEKNPLKTSTYGTGLLMKDAIDKGAAKIILGLGGSATNDAGMGILAALGFQFMNANGSSLTPSGENLALIEKIIYPASIPKTKFVIACDVQNVLFGLHGAAHIYGPQKGADSIMIDFLDKGLRHFADILKKQTGKDISTVPGTGAAGGIAAGLLCFFDVELKKGTELIIESSGIKNIMAEAILVITGEGKIDQQTLQGKVVKEISLLGEEYQIPVIAFCGTLEADASVINQLKLQFVGSLTSTVKTTEAMLHAWELLTHQAAQFFENYFRKMKG